LGQNNDYKIDISWIFAKHVSLRITSKDWSVRNKDNVSKWGDRSIHGLLIHRKEFEDTKGVIRIRISMKKNIQHNGQKKNDTRTNNDLQNKHTKLKIE